MATYVMSDIHNDYAAFADILKQINFGKEDVLYILGDLFDRGGMKANPVALYREIRKRENIFVLRGNHDQWLSEKILDYFASGKRNPRYFYNTFSLLQNKMPEVEQLEMARWIQSLPLYLDIETEVNGEKRKV